MLGGGGYPFQVCMDLGMPVPFGVIPRNLGGGDRLDLGMAGFGKDRDFCRAECHRAQIPKWSFSPALPIYSASSWAFPWTLSQWHWISRMQIGVPPMCPGAPPLLHVGGRLRDSGPSLEHLPRWPLGPLTTPKRYFPSTTKAATVNEATGPPRQDKDLVVFRGPS